MSEWTAPGYLSGQEDQNMEDAETWKEFGAEKRTKGGAPALRNVDAES